MNVLNLDRSKMAEILLVTAKAIEGSGQTSIINRVEIKVIGVCRETLLITENNMAYEREATTAK